MKKISNSMKSRNDDRSFPCKVLDMTGKEEIIFILKKSKKNILH